MAIKDDIENFRKDRILGEAERLFYERGFAQTSMDAIAESVQATKPFIYGSYSSKADILFDIHLRVVRRGIDAVEAARAEDGTPAENLRSFALRLTDVVLTHQSAVAVFYREESVLTAAQLRKINDLKGKLDDGVAALLMAGVDTGDFELADPRVTALAVGGMIAWCFTWYRPNGRLTPAEIGERMAEYTLRLAGHRPRPPARRKPTRT